MAEELKVRMFQPYIAKGSVEAIAEVLASGNLTLGPRVAEFEQKFGEYVGNPYCVATNSCTSALHMALELCNVRGGEVITTPQTMEATGLAILMAGAQPVFADIDPTTGNLTGNVPDWKISTKIRAVLVVHWGGYPADLARLEQCEWPMIDDAAHALGASYMGKPIGAPGVSRATCFSFQAIKHITTGGDGGMLCLADEETYLRARRMRWYGIDRDRRKASLLGDSLWPITDLGYKYNMNDLSAALGLCGMAELQYVLDMRGYIADNYLAELRDVSGITFQRREAGRRHANWLFTMFVEGRDDFCRAMRSRGIEVSVVHRRIDWHPIFRAADKMDTLPGATEFDRTQINLPLHTGLTDDDVGMVIDAVKRGW